MGNLGNHGSNSIYRNICNAGNNNKHGDQKSFVTSATMTTNTHTLVKEATMVTLVTTRGLHM